MSSGRAVLIQLSDPHLREGDASRSAALVHAVATAQRLAPQAVGVVVTGDIADNGAPAEYAAARSALRSFHCPVLVMPGNKDDRAQLRGGFGLPGEAQDPIRGVFSAGPLRVLVCDTLVPGELHGDLDVEWVAAQLAGDLRTPTVLAMHHPPVPIGATAADAIGLPADQRAALAQALHGTPNVVRIVCGHVHRAATGMLAGVPVTTAPSVSFQLGLDLVGDQLAPSDDPPGLLLHVLTDEGLVTHVQPL